MAVIRPVFLDTSVLLGGLIELAGKRAPAQLIFDAVAAGRLGKAQTAWHCCLEFYSVATRLPEEFRLAPADAARLVEQELLQRLEILDLAPARRRDFVRASAADGMAGGRVYDAHVAEVARAGGARRVVTDNRRHFLTLLRHGVVVLTASEFAAEARLGRSRAT